MGTESGSSELTNALGNYALVFVSRKIPSNGSAYYDATGSMPGVQPWGRFQVSAPGKLIIRDANGTMRTLVDGSKPTAASLNLIDVNAPDVSYDATKIIFSGLPNGSYSTAPMTNPGAWRIYMINVDGTGLKQITFSDRNINLSQFGNLASNFTTYDDTDPVWLPDGRIVFSSTRWPSFGQYGAARTSNLYVINADGKSLHRITAERSGAERPIVDPLTGRIVYSRWWRNLRVGADSLATITNPQGGYIMKDGLCAVNHSGNECTEVGGKSNLWRNAWHLASINPDGTGLSQFTGRSNSFFVGENSNHAYGGVFASDGSFYANFFPMTNGTEAAGFGGIRHYARGVNEYIPIIGITTRDESVQQFARANPPSYGVYVGNYAAEPEVLPDGRLVISWARDTKQDYGLYTINSDGSGLSLVYDNVGTTELRARLVRPRSVPPILPDKVTQVASALPPTAQGPYDIDGTFTFNDLNVYFNAPVDANIVNAPPVGSADTIRFYIDHQRNQQSGSFENLDWPILLKEVPINPDGSLSTLSPANVPLFEQLRTSQSKGYKIPLTGPGLLPQESPGASHVAGMNFGRTGEVATCVGCHAGHTMISVPANPADAKWTNLAPGATVTVSSTGGGSSTGINDRRLKLQMPYDNFKKFWVSNSGSPTSQWAKLAFPVPITVKTVRLYNIPSTDSNIKILNATIRLYSDTAGTTQVASKTSGALSENGTDVTFDNVLARVVRIEFTSVSGSIAGLGEVEVIARAEADVPLLKISGNVGVGGVTLSYTDGGTKTVTSKGDGSYTITVPGGWSGTVTPTSTCHTFAPLNLSYSNLGANISGQNYTSTFNTSIGCSNINVTIGGNTQGNYGIGTGQRLTDRYGINGGPVRVRSTNGVNMFTSQRAIYGSSFNSIVGFPANQLTTEYWFTSLDDAGMITYLVIGNPSETEAALVDVYIGGVKKNTTPYSIPPGQRVFPRYGINGGPVRVVSTNGVSVFTSERTKYGNSFNEVMGFPSTQLDTEFWFTSYDDAGMITYLVIGNPSETETAEVDVYIGGVKKNTTPYSILPGQRVFPRYGVNGGPVRVVSTNGVNIFASERTTYQSSFNEVIGFPVHQLTTEYWFTSLDDASMITYLVIGNPSETETAEVDVYIGGVKKNTTPYSILPGQRVFPRYGINGGPVRVVSTNGVSVFTSERTKYLSSFNEILGIPTEGLTTDYWYTSLDDVGMTTELVIAAP
ncbi:MAG: hypothetical protein IPP66_21720 [Anaerolineales bacterium]|nr:hypothetical protein [Anaerolineales bacterium]